MTAARTLPLQVIERALLIYFVHLQKCIAHRVAKLYGLETLTVSNSENTPSVGVRRTRKSVHIPAVQLTLPGLCNLPLQPLMSCAVVTPILVHRSALLEDS